MSFGIIILLEPGNEFIFRPFADSRFHIGRMLQTLALHQSETGTPASCKFQSFEQLPFICLSVAFYAPPK
jgi:hypothetical protein